MPAWPRRLAANVIITLIIVCGAVYQRGLDHGPVYLGGDEAHFGVHGHAIAQDGRNLDGLRLPLFVNLYDPAGDQQPRDLHTRWYQPMLFYILALELQIGQLNEVTLRLPIAFIAGIVIPLLTFEVARRLFGSPVLAAVAALVIVTSPTRSPLHRHRRCPARRWFLQLHRLLDPHADLSRDQLGGALEVRACRRDARHRRNHARLHGAAAAAAAVVHHPS
jgi:hypothetical protein